MISLAKVVVSLLAVGLLAVGLLTLVACGDEEEIVERPSDAFTATTAAESTRVSPAETAGTPNPTPAPAATPTPLPPPKPPGYLHGEEHGIALLQTKRTPSETRDGWVDITLFLAIRKFAGDGYYDYEADENSFCLLNSQLPNDCLFVAWGSEEQFEAELDWQLSSEAYGFNYKTEIAMIIFEVAANATNAGLFFTEGHKIPLNLQGDEPIDFAAADTPAPTPPASSGPSEGYFMAGDYGIAITGVRSQPLLPSVQLPGMSNVTLYLSVVYLGEDAALAPEIYMAEDEGDFCPESDSSTECLSVRWGNESQFESALGGQRTVWRAVWPRGKGLPISLEMLLPTIAREAVIEFGEHSIPIDLWGMTGEPPVWDYKLHYPEIQEGSELYDSYGKTVVLEEIRQEKSFGNIVLVFSASNDSEASDFAPVIEITGSRVSESGEVLDDESKATETGWTFHTIRMEGDKLAPGQNAQMEQVIPLFQRTENWTLYHPDGSFRPDGAVLQFTVSDSLTGAGTGSPILGYVRFSREAEGYHFGKSYFAGSLYWRYKTGDDGFSSPAVADGVVYVGSEDYYLYALDAGSGRLVWRYETGDDVVSSPAVADGVVYVGSWDHFVYALDAGSGRLVWRYETGKNVVSSPAVADGVVYVGSIDNYVYALDAGSGRLVWRYETGDDVISSPTVADGVVYVGSSDDYVYALDAGSGRLVWRYETGSDVGSSPTVADGVVYVGSGDNYVYGIASGR